MDPLRTNRRVYLDHAATSWPKPPGVNEAWLDFQNRIGVAAGRGNYRSSIDAQQIVESVRRQLALLIGASKGSSIALVHNGTAALNLAFSGLLRSGDHVVTTQAEHNSVLRPLHRLQQSALIELSIVPCDELGWVDPAAIEGAIQSNTKMVVITHASNVTGRVQAIEAIGDIARKHGCWFMVDAAQTLGYLPIDVQATGIDLMAAPGHKGACGVMGCGMLYATEEVANQLQSPWLGGTGTHSESLEGPSDWPMKVEAGNLNVPALAAWDKGLTWLIERSADPAFQQFHASMYERLRSLLRSSNLGTVIGHQDNVLDYVSVLSLKSLRGIAASDIAGVLDSSFQIEVRSGLHCAALIHQPLQTLDQGGTIRFSLGHTSTHEDLDHLESALEQLSHVFT